MQRMRREVQAHWSAVSADRSGEREVQKFMAEGRACALERRVRFERTHG